MLHNEVRSDMLDYGFFLDLAVILLSTKLLGLLTRKAQMPQVVGALVAGLIIGPSCLNMVHESEFLMKMAELGVLMLMFTAGLETDLDELKKTGVASLIIAGIGVVVPLIGGFIAYAGFYGHFDFSDTNMLLQSVFIGVVLTATSVSITVETLRELGKLKGKVGTAILGAAVIDDIIGIIVLTIVIGFKDPSVNPAMVLLRIVGFFAFVAIVAVLAFLFFRFRAKEFEKKRRFPIYGLVFCLLMAYVAEHFFGIADITGAYLAGIILCNTQSKEYINRRVEITSYMMFAPIFFASIGINTKIEGIDGKLLLFSLILLAVAILSKVIGCGFGAKLCKFTNFESLVVGVGMVSRGEVALIVAQKGAQAGLLNPIMFTSIVLVVIVTTLITPILLKVVYSKDPTQRPIKPTTSGGKPLVKGISS